MFSHDESNQTPEILTSEIYKSKQQCNVRTRSIITTHHHNKILHTNPKSEEKKENFSPRHVKTTKNRTTNPCTQPKVAYKRTTVIRASIDVSRYKKNTQHQSRPNSCSLSTTSHSIVPAHSKATTDNNHTIKCWRKATRKIDTQRK